MTSRHVAMISIAFIGGWTAGLILTDRAAPPAAAFAQNPTAKSEPTVAALQAEVDQLKKVVPDQSHAMHDVDYHFANLWFAGQQGNWPLAQFYWSETRSHLRWAVRIIPIRKDNAGKEVLLEKILESVENSPLKQLHEAIEAQDRGKFTAAYEFMLTGCHSCHKASDKPYLRPRIPDHPATPMINFDPNASWPP